MPSISFVERRKDYRLPYSDKVIFTDGNKSTTAYAANFSRGGLFVKTLEPYPIESIIYLGFLLPSQPGSLIVKAKVAHIVFDKQRSEIECGIGFEFMELDESRKSILNVHVLNEKMNYLELQKILEPAKPNLSEVERYIKKIPILQSLDLLALRYKVNRICTLFEPPLEAESVESPPPKTVEIEEEEETEVDTSDEVTKLTG